LPRECQHCCPCRRCPTVPCTTLCEPCSNTQHNQYGIIVHTRAGNGSHSS
jgi:hypothetical protein